MKTLAEVTRELVMEYMHYSGRLAGRLTNDQFEAVYLLGDGFGKIDHAFAADQCWDWSHIRDSSEDAITKMAQQIMLFADR